MSPSENGIVYVATGQSYYDEALASIRSARAAMPDVPVTLFTDVDADKTLIDNVAHVADPSYSTQDKITCMAKSPYAKSIFIDTDTYVCQSIADLYELLDHFDIAAVLPSFRATQAVEGIPPCFPGFNTGVVAYRKTPATDRFFEKWLTTHEHQLKHLKPTFSRWRPFHDQYSFREALYDSELRIATLGPEYNCMHLVPGYVHGQVRVFHGRDRKFLWRNLTPSRAAAVLNKKSAARVFVAAYGKMRIGGIPRLEGLLRFVSRRRPRHGLIGAWRLALARMRDRRHE